MVSLNIDTDYVEQLAYDCNLLKQFRDKLEGCALNTGHLCLSIGTGNREIALSRELTYRLSKALEKAVNEEIKKNIDDMKSIVKVK